MIVSYNPWMHHAAGGSGRGFLHLAGRGSPLRMREPVKCVLEWLLVANGETDYTALHNCCFNPLSEEI